MEYLGDYCLEIREDTSIGKLDDGKQMMWYFRLSCLLHVIGMQLTS